MSFLSIYHFARLVEKYSRPYVLLAPQEGVENDRGKVVQPEPKREDKRAAIVPYDKRIVFRSGGALLETDRLMVSLTELPSILDNVRIEYEGNIYSVQSENNFTSGNYADFFNYRLKWVSQLDRSSEYRADNPQEPTSLFE